MPPGTNRPDTHDNRPRQGFQWTDGDAFCRSAAGMWYAHLSPGYDGTCQRHFLRAATAAVVDVGRGASAISSPRKPKT